MKNSKYSENLKKEKRTFIQAYLIKKEEIGKSNGVEIMDYMFMDYTESRKKARNILSKMNMKKSTRLFTGTDSIDLFKEVIPDVWTDGQMKVSIEVFLLKDAVIPETKILNKINRKRGILENMEFVDQINMIENNCIVLK